MHYPFEITKEFAFEGAHHLPQMPEGHQCKRPHGHSYRIELTLGDVELDDDGFVLDFGELGAIVKGYIDSYLDHRDLAAIFGGENTTAERLAIILFYIFKPKLPQLTALAVRETVKTCATYRPAQGEMKGRDAPYHLARAGIEESVWRGFPR